MKLLAGSIKSFTHRGGCFRLKHALFCGGIDWHGCTPSDAPYPLRRPVANWTQAREAVKYNSDYALILQPLPASTSQPCKSVCRLGPPGLPFFRTCRPVFTDATRCRRPDRAVLVADRAALATPQSCRVAAHV